MTDERSQDVNDDDEGGVVMLCSDTCDRPVFWPFSTCLLHA